MSDELKEKIAEIIDVSFVGIFYAPSPEDRERMINEYASQILVRIREAGWKSPEDYVICPDCAAGYELREFIKGVE